MLVLLYSSLKVQSSSIETMTMCHFYVIKEKGDEHSDEFHARFTECVSRIGDVPDRHVIDRLHQQLTGTRQELFESSKTSYSGRKLAAFMVRLNTFRSGRKCATFCVDPDAMLRG
jgi:hypothetical protein